MTRLNTHGGVDTPADGTPDSHPIRMKSRPQNEIIRHPTTGRVTKRSGEVDAILAEAAWYATLGTDADLAPAYYGSSQGTGWASYELEYVPWPTAAHSLLHGWTTEHLGEFLTCLDTLLTRLHLPAPDAITTQDRTAACKAVFLDKTIARLDEWEPSAPARLWHSGVTVNGEALPPLKDIRALLPDLVTSSSILTPHSFRRIHGDLYPGNILYDTPTRSIKVVDPRGSFGTTGSYGDPLYDLAKLAHSFIGGFDYLVAGRYQLTSDLSCLELDLPVELTARFNHWLARTTSHYQVTPETMSLAHALVLLALPAQHAHDPQRATALTIRGMQALKEHL